MATLPVLQMPVKQHSALTQRLASLSPKSPKGQRSSKPTLETPPSPSRSSSPTKIRMLSHKEFAAPFPITPTSLPRRRLPAANDQPETPSRSSAVIPFPQTPTSSDTDRPSTPTNQSGSTPATPTSSRRAALYDRIRKRSESQVPQTPSKVRITTSGRGSTRDQMTKLGQEEMRRRCLLGRLSGIAENIWMYVYGVYLP